MKEAKVKTPNWKFFINYEDAINHLETIKENTFVLKADGICAGKGVIIPETKKEAKEALQDYFINKKFGEAGSRVIIEEKIFGQEVSLLVFCDKETYKFLPVLQDHKRVLDNDKGKNTGGMGAYTPVKFFTKEHMKKVEKEIIIPTLEVMTKQGSPFRGLLYCGLMMQENDISVIEFNVRFGDPECQCILPLLESDLFEILNACVNDTLKDVNFKIKNQASCSVAIVSGGYPNKYEKWKENYF